MSREIPPGKAMGCLPRRSKPGAICPFFKDRIKVIPKNEWDDYTGQISLKPYVETVLDQDGVGSCATESTAQSVMVTRAVAGLPHVVLNPWFIYHTTSRGVDRGSAIDDNLEFVRERGIAPMSVWPRSEGWRATPSDEAVDAALDFKIEEFYDIQTTEECVSALLLGFPVIYGASGHSVLKIEHLNDREGLDVNSWAETWGDGGFGVWAPYRDINWHYGMFAIRVPTFSTSNDKRAA